jgi:hypothetical protein
MQDILVRSPSLVVDDNLKGVVPFLPLDDLNRPGGGTPAQSPAPGNSPPAPPASPQRSSR